MGTEIQLMGTRILVSKYNYEKEDWEPSITYHRSGFDCKILINANCEFSGACNQKNRNVSLNLLLLYGTGSTIAIIKIAIWLD